MFHLMDLAQPCISAPGTFGTNPVIGVKPADEYQFRIFTTPGTCPYFKGGVKPLTIRISDFDRAALMEPAILKPD